MKLKRSTIWLFLCLFISSAWSYNPADQAVKPQSSQAINPAQVKDIEDYLNGIKTLRASFEQKSPGKENLTGKMYLERSSSTGYGKARFDYTPPSKMNIIADGKELRYTDETGEVNKYDIDRTPASFLLRRIDFSHDPKVQNMETKNGKIHLSLMGDDEKTLTLIFKTSPHLVLQGWIAPDGQGNNTQVTLTNVEIGMPFLDDNLFIVE